MHPEAILESLCHPFTVFRVNTLETGRIRRKITWAQALKDAVTETEDVFRDDLLAQQSVADLLTVPILDLADRWRT